MLARGLVVCVYTLVLASCGEPTPTVQPSASSLFDEIQALRVVHIERWSELPKHTARRSALIEQYVALGDAAGSDLLPRVSKSLEDDSFRDFWLPILLRLQHPGIKEVMHHVGRMSLTTREWRNIAYALKFQREDWALLMAVTLLTSPDVGTRTNSIESLKMFRSPLARDRLVAIVRSDPNESVRASAADVRGSQAFLGTFDELACLIEAVEDPSVFVRASAMQSLESIVDKPLHPAPIMHRREDKIPDEVLARRRVDSWLAWWNHHRTRIRWDGTKKVFVAK